MLISPKELALPENIIEQMRSAGVTVHALR